ncbi:glycerol-3-phosphate 1-O-acyltransferase PlsY [Sphingomicrobium nitratireducens]|uniref:glycerol-3-phosphate 1-O-acyltransferase PlsY n=1 Tax=Sphingomicrobium nitratireducens TaxID=2964666 RepID=UPI0022405D1F|nr:glycerol-3-phosphate 1-O-acyltransferase PlsY [Sphingomicrobium nitratireducens]
MPPLDHLLMLGLGYLLGSIPFGLILAKMAGKGDLRDVGSGNIGATNAARAGGKGLGAAVLLLDAIKGAVAVALAKTQVGDLAAMYAAAGALIGHLYPVWLRFRGGKGVATLFGVLVPLLPVAALVYALVWIGLLLVVRISSVSGLVAAVSAPVTAAFAGAENLVPMLLGFTLLIVWKHRENLRRLVAGKEPRIGSSREQSSETDHRGSD